ncbi:MAG TPA: hypothetical protein VJ861_03745 [Treponemataceae bacterium]|nr:hypothetical protein [Treponemataceae bacterium]
MYDLMSFDLVAEHLHLDSRDELRNRLYLKAASQLVCAYLGRNLLTETTTEQQKTSYKEFYTEEYPVQEFLEIKDIRSGRILSLAEDTPVLSTIRPDSYRNRAFRLEGISENEVTIEYTYRFGYEVDEMPGLIQACVLELIRDRLESLSTIDTEMPTPEQRLKSINAFRKLNI